MNNFKNWIDTFIDEKDLPMEDTFTIDKNGTYILTDLNK